MIPQSCWADKVKAGSRAAVSAFPRARRREAGFVAGSTESRMDGWAQATRKDVSRSGKPPFSQPIRASVSVSAWAANCTAETDCAYCMRVGPMTATQPVRRVGVP